MKKATLLINFFRENYYGAYDQFIEALRPWLLIYPQKPRLVERLDFRPDLQRGDKSRIYREIARLLKSGSSMFVRGYCKNDFFRWLADPRHCNMGGKSQTIQSAVNKRLMYDF